MQQIARRKNCILPLCFVFRASDCGRNQNKPRPVPPMKNLLLILKATEQHLIDNAWSASDIGRVGLDDCETLTDYEASLLAAMKAVWDDMDLGQSFESPEEAVAAVVDCVFDELFHSLRSEAARA